MKHYDIKIRKMAIDAVISGRSTKEEVCKTVGCNISTLNKWLARFIKIREYSGDKAKGRPSVFRDEHIEQVRQMIIDKPDITLAELISNLNLPVGIGSMHRLVKKLNFTYKKKLYTPKNVNVKMS